MCMTKSSDRSSAETVTARALRGRRNKRLQALATARRLALESDRVARDQRVDFCVVDVLAAREAWARAMEDAAAADAATVEALRRLRAEGISLSAVAELSGLTTAVVRRLLADTVGSPQPSSEPTRGTPAPTDAADQTHSQTRRR